MLRGPALAFAFLLAGTALTGAQPETPAAFDTAAPQALLVDAGTGTVLFSKSPDTRIAPAALAKLMTMEVVFDALKNGRASLTDTFKVSEHAWRTGGAPSRGSTMFAALNSTLTLNDLIQGVIVQSANDGCIIIAEGMAGSEEKFAELMNARAKAIGLTGSVFKNPTGLPAEGQVVTLRDLVTLGQHIWRTYPDLYVLYAQPAFEWNKIFQRNRNPLLALNIGADGMGTGFTEESGYAILGSAQQNERRLFAAMSGMTSEKERAEEARKLIEYGMNGFEMTSLFESDAVIGRVRVFGGTRTDVGVIAGTDVSALLPTEQPDRIKMRVSYDGPVEAPVAKGQPLGELEILVGETLAQTVPLFAADTVERGTLYSRAADGAKELAFGWLR